MKKIATYLGITFALTWAVWGGLSLLNIGLNTSLLAQGVVALTMWFPALGAFLAHRLLPEGKAIESSFRPHFKGNGKAYLVAWLFPTLFMGLGALLYFAFLPGQFDASLRAFTAPNAPGDPGMMMGVTLAFSVLGAPFINTIFALGEEIGWRGFLYPALRRHLSERRAILLCGLIWGLWHAPITCMGHNYGLGYWGYPWAGIAAMCVFCLSLGIILSWLTTNTRSIWAAAIAHGAVNAVAGLPTLFLSGVPASYALLGPAYTGLLAGIPLMLFALVLWRRHYARPVNP